MRSYFIIFFLFLASNAFATDSLLHLQLRHTYHENVIDFTTDNLGNIYLVTATNQVKKINEQGDSIAVYNNVRRYGKISAVDASNPLKVLVFYKDYATIVVLDRLLNVRNTIDLRKFDIFQASAVTSSYDNQIWLFDEMNSRLKKVDDNGRGTLESVDMRQAFAKAPLPIAMYDRDGSLYCYDSTKGLLVFDYYGALLRTHPLPAVHDLQVLDKNTVTGRSISGLFVYKPATMQAFFYKTVDNLHRYKKIQFQHNKLFVLNNEGLLQLYDVKEN